MFWTICGSSATKLCSWARGDTESKVEKYTGIESVIKFEIEESQKKRIRLKKVFVLERWSGTFSAVDFNVFARWNPFLVKEAHLWEYNVCIWMKIVLFVLIVFVYNYNLTLLSIGDCLIPLCWAWRHTIKSCILPINGRGLVNLNYACWDSCYHHGQIPDIFAHRCIWKMTSTTFHHVCIEHEMLSIHFLEPRSNASWFLTRTEFNLNVPRAEWLFWSANLIFVILFPHAETVCDGKVKSSWCFRQWGPTGWSRSNKFREVWPFREKHMEMIPYFLPPTFVLFRGYPWILRARQFVLFSQDWFCLRNAHEKLSCSRQPPHNPISWDSLRPFMIISLPLLIPSHRIILQSIRVPRQEDNPEGLPLSSSNRVNAGAQFAVLEKKTNRSAFDTTGENQ